MNCPRCSAVNDINNAFCVNCGEVFRASSNLPPTLLPPSDIEQSKVPTQDFPASRREENDYPSDPTVFGGRQPNFQPSNANYQQSNASFQPSNADYQYSNANFNPSIPFFPPPQPAPKPRYGLWIAVIGGLLLLIFGGAVGAYFLLNKPKTPAEVLPNHLGIFFQNNEKTAVEEIKKQDYTNALEGKDKILKDETMPTIESKPNLILYSDGKDIPLNDLKLIQLDSIKSDGTMKQIDFKATPIDGKPEMKRLWFAENLAKGKYAFALLDGFLDDGKHKLWVFQVKNSDKTDNASLLKDLTVALKNKSSNSNQQNTNTNANVETTKVTPTPKPSVVPPVGSRTGFANTNNVVVRAAPSLDARKVSGLKNRQKVYVLGSSNNYDYWNGLEGNWVNIQTESGQRGWVFSPFISY